MNKILIAFDGSHYSESALQHAKNIARQEGAFIVGVFIEDLTFMKEITFATHPPFAMGYSALDVKEILEEAGENVASQIHEFKTYCEKHNLNYEIHHDRGVSVEVLINESYFADLLIIGYRTYFSHFGFDDDRVLVKEVLKNSGCPNLVVPENYTPIENIILAYDNKPSSIFSIKQFAYLFRNMSQSNEISFLHITDNATDELEEADKLMEYLRVHFPKLNIMKKVGKPEEELLHFAEITENPLLVTSSFGRNALSQLINPGVSKELLKAAAVPTFIAHTSFLRERAHLTFKSDDNHYLNSEKPIFLEQNK